MEKEFEKLSPWIMINHCATRVIKGTDPNVVDNRIAFIEKSPRVREYGSGRYKNGRQEEDHWIYGAHGDGQLCGLDQESRNWCDAMLELLGW